jgi:uncharacterized membrane protein
VFPIFVLFGIVHLFIVLVNHYYFRTFAFDYGSYNFAFYDYAHLRISDCPVYTVFGVNRTFLQDHFSLTLMLLSPLYWLMYGITGTYTLLIIQWVFILGGGWFTYKLIFFKSENTWMALLSLLYYFFMYGRYSSYQNDCNLAIIGSAIFPVFIYYFEKRNLWGTILSFSFLIINREDFPLCLIFICLFLALLHRKNKTQLKLALILALISLVSFALIFVLFIPALHSANEEFRLFDYTALGSGPLEALLFILQHPLNSISYLFINHTQDPALDGIKAGFYLVYGLSGGILLLLRPAYLIFLIPFIAKKMYNDASYRWGYEFYYSVEIATVLPLLVFLIILNFKNLKLQVVSALVICLTAGSITVYSIHAADTSSSYLKFNFGNPNYFMSDMGNVSEIHQALSKIPSNASVSASTRLVANLALREKIYHFPVVEDAEYICLFKQRDSYPFPQEKFDKELLELKQIGSWSIETELANFIILKKLK